jgi:hypothetical protein
MTFLRHSASAAIFGGAIASLVFTACDTVKTADYEATALVSYTWQVEYVDNPDRPAGIRREKFATAMLLNRNGEKPVDAVTGPDDKGLWYPALPPRPNQDDIESRRKGQEQIGTPELIKGVEYKVKYAAEEQVRTLPTNADVYRQVSKAVKTGQAMEFLVGGDGRWVQQAKPR